MAEESAPSAKSRHGRDVIIDIGSNDGAEIGQFAEIYELRTVDLGLGQGAQEETDNVVGRVTLVAPSRASVHLGMHERAAAGWHVRFVEKGISASRSYPPRPPAYFELEGVLRPYLGNGGFGIYSEAGMNYHLDDLPLRFRARVDPIAVNKEFAGAAPYGLISIDGRLLEVALGGGYATKNLYDSKAGALVPVYLRLGTVDGVMGEMTNMFLVTNNSVEYAALRLSGYAPVSESLWFAIRIHGSRGGGFGEIGLRFLTVGTGGPGSLFLTPVIGGVGVQEQSSPNGRARGGLTLGLGTEFRM